MTEFFITARSFAAPFVSDTSEAYIEADTARAALEQFASGYRHPCGLYAAEAWASADAYHKGRDPLARWLSNHEQAKQAATSELDTYSYEGHGPGRFKVSGKLIEVADPTGGSVVA